MGRANAESFTFVGKIWRYPGKGGWHFVTLPADLSARIRFLSSAATRCFLLPIKAKARAAAGLVDGSTATFQIKLNARAG